MQVPGKALERAAFYFGFASAVSVLFSIAAANILLVLSLAALLMSGAKLRFPPIKLPLALFAGWTVLSLALSAEPSAGRPQLRKFFIFLMLLVAASAFRELKHARALTYAWAGVAALSAFQSFIQLYDKLRLARAAGRDFYEYYMMERTSGFMSHWMTFGSLQMYVLIFVAAYLMWSPARGRRWWLLAICGLLIGASIFASFTRSIWIAAAAAGLYLMWNWRPKLLPLAPLALVALYVIGPPAVKARFHSFYQPRGDTDSNQFRRVCWITGMEMIKARPITGLGPEHVKLQFEQYVPNSIPRPLPAGWYGHLHNIYIHYAAERGIPALLILLWLLGKIGLDFWRGLRSLPPGPGDRRFLLHGALAALLATLIVGVFELNLGDSEVLLMFLVIVSLGYLALRNEGAAQHV